MISKLAVVPDVDEHGIVRSYPFSSNGSGLEKYKSLPEDVQYFVDKLWRPRDGTFGVLEVAMGASEYWGQNANADIWPEAALNHVPPGWTGDPAADRILAASWEWGWPTFYSGHAFVHHKNNNPSKRVGEVEFVTYDPNMHWVLIVVSVDPDSARSNGGSWVVERVAAGRPISCSMGSRVPFDITTTSKEMDRYERAKASYDPSRHRNPAQAVLEEHARRKIDGLSRTRAEYPPEMLYHAGEILPSGVRIGVINDYPRFFDISFVGVPADPVAWSVMKLGATRCQLSGVRCGRDPCGSGACRRYKVAGAVLSDLLRPEDAMTKSAEIRLATLRKRNAVLKASDIEKEVRPQVAGARPLRPSTEDEPDIPRDILDRMAMGDIIRALSTAAMMGIILKPREFQRVVLVHIGRRPLADRLDAQRLFPLTSLEVDPSIRIEGGAFDDDVARMLMNLIPSRSCLGPMVRRRIQITVVKRSPPPEAPEAAREAEDSEGREVQRKVGALYAGYRRSVLDSLGGVKYALSQRPWLRDQVFGLGSILKHGGKCVTGMMTPLVTAETVEYARGAYL